LSAEHQSAEHQSAEHQSAEHLVHLTTPDGWDAATAAGQIAPPSLAADGFVHLSTPAQVPVTVARHFAGVDEVVVVQLDPDALPGPLTWAESHPGEHYPHHHAPIPLDAVLEAELTPTARFGGT
jgi:uncharacterized protein (DUF952 family)